MRPVLILTIMIWATLVSIAGGQIYLGGSVSGDLPPAVYFVNSNIIVSPGTELTILGGTELRFADSATFDVYGKLTVAGTFSGPVSFSPVKNGTWGGLRVYSGREGITLSSAIITGCGTGIYIAASVDTLRINFDKSIFRNCGTAVKDASGKELMAVQDRAVSGSCDFPGKGSGNLRDFQPVNHNTAGKVEDSGSRGLKLRGSTFLKKILLTAAAAALATFFAISSRS